MDFPPPFNHSRKFSFSLNIAESGTAERALLPSESEANFRGSLKIIWCVSGVVGDFQLENLIFCELN
jgi:hypothetical protein